MTKTPKAVLQAATLTALLATLAPVLATAQGLVVTPAQRQTASEVAQRGVALEDLAPNAPERYTVRAGDTLWGISTLYLKGPWRWPELWGMNLDGIRNPHLIYPGQVLVLLRADGRARLQLGDSTAEDLAAATVRVSPRNRVELLADNALPTLRPSAIEPFLTEPLVVEESVLLAAPRIVAAQEGRVMLTRGDRAYARGTPDAPLLDDPKTEKRYRVFRGTRTLKDPVTGEVLGHEAQFVGRATLVRSETVTEDVDADGKRVLTQVPATIDIVLAREEIRVGDRLLDEPPREMRNYTPHAGGPLEGARIVSVYGSAVVNVAQNQVVAINRGTRDGVAVGHVLALQKDGARLVDKTDAARPLLKLPDERNGLAMVFRTFERVSYALILEIRDSVRVGDRLVAPR